MEDINSEIITNKRKTKESIIYYGEIVCSKNLCTNKSYYEFNGNYLCGIHSRSITNRNKLIKRNTKDKLEMKEKKRQEQTEKIELARIENVNNNKKGKVILAKFRMMKEPISIDGFLNVFPNYKHQNRKDGVGCMKLSPKYLGPVEHGQFGLPPAKNIENFHQ